mgnify:CR=1 FL=1
MRVRLEEVCEKQSSKLKQSDVIDQNGLYPVYGASGYLGNINTYQQSNYYVAVVKDGAGIGRTMLLPPKSSIIGTMQYLIPKDNVLPEYLYYVVKAKHFEKYFSGATIPHIYFKDYKNEQFDLVSFEEQREIINRIKKIEIIIDDLLASTGMRVGELVNINIEDIDFENRECVVFGKGNKERPVYFDARTKIHLKNYLKSRTDDNPALFVSLDKPFNRLQISGVEIRLRNLGRRLGIHRVHPHKFRRTVATRAIDKGMPIEQVQSLLGHSQIDTTMHYAMVNQNNVKESHRKFVA